MIFAIALVVAIILVLCWIGYTSFVVEPYEDKIKECVRRHAKGDRAKDIMEDLSTWWMKRKGVQ